MAFAVGIPPPVAVESGRRADRTQVDTGRTLPTKPANTDAGKLETITLHHVTGNHVLIHIGIPTVVAVDTDFHDVVCHDPTPLDKGQCPHVHV